MIRAAPLRFERPTRREREVNWGDKTKIAGNEVKTLAWVSVEESSSMVVYATASIRGGFASGVTFVVNIEWGHGGASVDQDYPVVHRLRVPLAASMVKVSGRLLDANGNAPSANVSGDIAVAIARGNDGETLRNTRWISQEGGGGLISSRPARVMRVEGFNAGGADTFIHVNDGAPTSPAAGMPAILVPARAGRRFVVRRFDSQAFARGVTWAASSSALVFTPDKKASVRIDVELLL
jgi:hypothetical protein